MWKWIVSFIKALFGIETEPKAIQCKEHVCMPLFYVGENGKPEGTWNYFSKTAAERAHCRAQIKATAVDGETPAICFCLTPSDISGNIWSAFPVINQPNLDTVKEIIVETIEDGIACFPCLYVDDPFGAMPRWWEISLHTAAWRAVNDNLGDLFSGVVLSIETNERASSVGHMSGCIKVMISCFPDLQFYATHLQWMGRGKSGYVWKGGASTPKEINLLLVENSWDPHRGDAAGIGGMSREYAAIKNATGDIKKIWHEYNLNPGGAICQEQREYLRSEDEFGVG